MLPPAASAALAAAIFRQFMTTTEPSVAVSATRSARTMAIRRTPPSQRSPEASSMEPAATPRPSAVATATLLVDSARGVFGGFANQALANFSFVGGGFQNLIQTNALNAVIGGGSNNVIQAAGGLKS